MEETCIERRHLAAVHVSNSRYGPDWGHARHPGHACHPCIVGIQQTVAQLLVWGEGGSECAPRSSVLTCTLMALLDESGVALLNFREGRRALYGEDAGKSPFSIQAGVIMFLFHENIRCILVFLGLPGKPAGANLRLHGRGTDPPRMLIACCSSAIYPCCPRSARWCLPSLLPPGPRLLSSCLST